MLIKLSHWSPKRTLRSIIHAYVENNKHIKYRQVSSIISTHKIITCDPITTLDYFQTQITLKQIDQT